MKNNLISRREAEKLGATCLARRNENGQLEAIISLDNAPTVEPPEWQYEFVKMLYEKARPQGKWIIDENNMDYPDGRATCSHCGYKMDVKRWEWLPAVRWYLKPNYCPECGAKMET